MIVNGTALITMNRKDLRHIIIALKDLYKQKDNGFFHHAEQSGAFGIILTEDVK